MSEHKTPEASRPSALVARSALDSSREAVAQRGNKHNNILIIKHGALGDVVLATGPFAAIRRDYPDAHITLLTTPLYGKLLADAPYFDEIVIDRKPKPFDLRGIKALKTLLNAKAYDWVFDLQTSSRTPYYYYLFKRPKPKWSGIARLGVWGMSHPQPHGAREQMHTLDRHKDQLAIAGINDVPVPDVRWLKGAMTSDFHYLLVGESERTSATQSDPVRGQAFESLPPTESSHEDSTPPWWGSAPLSYCLLVPGGSAHRPEKRWPKEKFIELAQWCIEQGITPVILGAGAEEALCEQIYVAITNHSPLVGEPERTSATQSDPVRGQAFESLPPTESSSEDSAPPPGGIMRPLNLCNRTNFAQIAELARHATFAVGNDTGPIHLIAATQCKTIVLFNTMASNPDLCAPRGEHVSVMSHQDLGQVSCADITPLLPKDP